MNYATTKTIAKPFLLYFRHLKDIFSHRNHNKKTETEIGIFDGFCEENMHAWHLRELHLIYQHPSMTFVRDIPGETIPTFRPTATSLTLLEFGTFFKTEICNEKIDNFLKFQHKCCHQPIYEPVNGINVNKCKLAKSDGTNYN